MSERLDGPYVRWMVYIGAVGLIGLPATSVIASGFDAVLPLAMETDGAGGANWFSGAVFLSVYCVSILLGLQVAIEAAALQLYGMAALNRGPRWAVLLRHVGLSLSAVVFLAWVARFGVSVATGTDQTATLLVGAVLVGVSIWALVRAASRFVGGYKERSATGGTDESV